MPRIPSITRKRRSRARRPAARVGTSHPEGLRLIPVEAATATARPATIDKTYLELGHDALTLEQQHLFAAEGEVRSRSVSSTAKSLAFAVGETTASVGRAKSAAEKASVRHEQIRELLSPYVRRKATSSRGYMLRTAALLLGDTAGLAGAAIALGEYPALAVAQAISAGTATVTAGLAAAQLRHAQQAAERQTEDLPEALTPYRHLFNGPPKNMRLPGVAFLVAALIVLLVSVGIFALRSAIEGTISGLTFGGLAAAIALASFINSWYHADAVADVLESAQHDALVADRRHRRLAGSRLIRKAEQAGAQEKSIVAEHTHRGVAAGAHIEADKYRALLVSPDVIGHGPAPDAVPAPVTGAQPIKRVRPA
ncbi:hypothetical protein [Mycolicibacterium gilvum]|uniref:Uncharacterized protein n=1 Tax=Mycolicibacterium gilvum (strain DSM 45189 / LMG 24558 / Spyr1) TaxID=278137 RepID=E6TKG9_MYCSR|nr:hypothetical protein [Mycolicibacterium gilvum]ADU00384.1 hypothetical protein Mspyr1_37840 [Mycolicibacterium gilvum Spyr1]